MAEQRYRARPRHDGPTPGQVLGPAAGVVVLLLLVALLVHPGSFVVSLGSPGPAPSAAPSTAPADAPSTGPGTSAGRVPTGPSTGGRAAPPRPDPGPPPPDPRADALAAVADLLLARDAAVVAGDAQAWTAASADPTDAVAPDGSFAVLTSLPVTRFESSLVPDTLQPVEDPVTVGGDWQARVDTRYELGGVTAVIRTDTLVLASPTGGAGWRPVSWTPYPAPGELGTAAPWDLGAVRSTLGERGVVLSWADPEMAVDGVPPQREQDAQAWGASVSTWVDRGAVVVDSYLGTGWPRSTLVLAPATSGQYDALVPGPAPDRPDVFAAVTTDVHTPDGEGDLVVLNPTARPDLVEETWQVTLTHELVHVASGALLDDGQEVWLAEGLADLVGWSSVVPATASREEVAARLLERVRNGTADVQALPDPEDFTAAERDVVGDAYEGAWLAALLLQDELGEDGFLRLYAEASGGTGPAPERTDAALHAATGDGRAAFQARWTAYVTSLAR